MEKAQIEEQLAIYVGEPLEFITVYQLDDSGKYLGETVAYESPQDKAEGRPRVWMIPAGCVLMPPPAPQEGKDRYYIGTATDGVWEYRDIPLPEPEPELPPPTPEEIYARNLAMKRSLLQIATLEIAPLQDAVDFGEATPEEEALLGEWKQYRILVNRVDLTLVEPNWPNQPQA